MRDIVYRNFWTKGYQHNILTYLHIDQTVNGKIKLRCMRAF